MREYKESWDENLSFSQIREEIKRIDRQIQEETTDGLGNKPEYIIKRVEQLGQRRKELLEILYGQRSK